MFNLKRTNPPLVEIGDFDESELEIIDQTSLAIFVHGYLQGARASEVPLLGKVYLAFDFATQIFGNLDLDQNENNVIIVNYDQGQFSSMCFIVNRDLPSMSVIIT